MNNRLFTISTAVLLLTSSLSVKAQNTSVLWARHLDSNSTFVDCKPAGDGGYIAAGGINPSGNTTPASAAIAGENAWLVKMDDTGGVIWQRSYGGSNFERFIQVYPTTDGGYIAAGYTKSTDGDVTGNNGGSDIWVVKTDDTGAIAWSRCYGGSNHEQMNTILWGGGAPFMTNMMQATPDGGYVIMGTTTSDNGDVSGFHGGSAAGSEGYGDIWMIKIDSLGALLWQKCIGGSMNEWASTVLNTPDGGVIIGAVTSSSDGDATGSGQHGGRHSVSQGGDYWVIKTDSLATIEWQKCYGGSSFEVTNGLIACNEGGYLIAGGSYSTDGDVSAQIPGQGNYTKPWMVKINDTGRIEWDRSYWVDSAANGFSTPNWESIQDIIQNPDGTYSLIVVTSQYQGIVKMDSLGIISSFNHYADKNKPSRLLRLSDGSYIGTGGFLSPYSTRKSGTDIPQALIMKYAACPSYTYRTASVCKGDSYPFGNRSITSAGIYWDTLTMASGCDSLVNLILTMDSIATPGITASDNTLSTGTYSSYQWLDGSNNPISGATARTYEATTAGNYRVVATGANGCADTSTVYTHTPSSIHESALSGNMKLYPNPASHMINIEIPQLKDNATLEIRSADGRVISTGSFSTVHYQLSIENIPGGIYFIKISTAKGMVVRKVVKK